jgi:RNA polymerase sigma-70 factor (ECF subfamily)
MTVSREIDDPQLVERTLRGDSEAFGALVDRYQGYVYGFIYRKIDNFADAEDLTQDTFIKAFQKLDQLQKHESSQAWLLSIATNSCHNYWRSRRNPPVSIDLPDVSDLCDAQAVSQWRDEQSGSHALDALASLPEETQLIASLHYISGWTAREIAESFGISQRAAAYRIARTRKQLRAELIHELSEVFKDHRLPENFKERVLRRISLYPVEEGWGAWQQKDDGSKDILLRVNPEASDTTLIALSMDNEDVDAITCSGKHVGPIAEARARSIETILAALSPFDVQIKEVVLRLDSNDQCLTEAVFRNGRAESTVKLRLGEGLCLVSNLTSASSLP